MSRTFSGLVCANACWAAPNAGVFVTAPESKPTITGMEMPVVQWKASVRRIPRAMTPSPIMFISTPSFFREEKNPGPTCRPKV